MRNATGKRDNLKAASRHRILDTAARRLRHEGVDGTAIVPVMREAGLTHGAFYSHFASKEDLAVAAFSHAITTGRPRWTKARNGEGWTDRLKRLATQYLTSAHRDDLASSCGFAALSSDAARGTPEFRAAYERELRQSLAAICEGRDNDPSRLDDAIAMMAICVGGLSLARAVPDKEFSERILRVARAAANITANAETTETRREDGH
ncbi:MAG: TetR/AcrR family transcriptional regulator [Mycobacterium sp.]|uniref:TetR/AcrR family transcriptional regulator n=1 Tax=Mycobacterium sp. TaxID=1785 RepID=UPI003F9AD95C